MSQYLDDWIDLVEDDYPLPREDLYIRDLLVLCRGHGKALMDWREKLAEIERIFRELSSIKFKLFQHAEDEMPHWSIYYQLTQSFLPLERSAHELVSSCDCRARDDLEVVYRTADAAGQEDVSCRMELDEEVMESECPPEELRESILESDVLSERLDTVEISLKPAAHSLKHLIHDRQRLLGDAQERFSAKLQSEGLSQVLDDLFFFAKSANPAGADAVLALAACNYDSPVQLYKEVSLPELKMTAAALPDGLACMLEQPEKMDILGHIGTHADSLFSQKKVDERRVSIKFFNVLLNSGDQRISESIRTHAQQSLIRTRIRLQDDPQRTWVATLPDERLLFCPFVAQALFQVLRAATEIIFETDSMTRIYKDMGLHLPLREHIISVGVLARQGNKLAFAYLTNKLFKHEIWEHRQMAASVLCPLISQSQGMCFFLMAKMFDSEEHSHVRATIRHGFVSALSSGKIYDQEFMKELEDRAQNYMVTENDYEIWRSTKQAATFIEQGISSPSHEFRTLVKKRNLVASGKYFKLRGVTSPNTATKQLSDYSVRSLRNTPQLISRGEDLGDQMGETWV